MHIEGVCIVSINRGDTHLHEIEFDVRSVFVLPLLGLTVKISGRIVREAMLVKQILRS